MADRTSLSRATESSDAPTPGYLYLDIARGAAASPAACQETAQYLIRRLQNKQNHNIKLKCLKVIQKTAENNLTRGQFKREICQNSNAIASIKDALQFRGPPDPIRGDAIYEKVRIAAKECLDAVYSESPSSEMAIGSSHNAGLAGGISSNYGQQNNFGGPPQGGAVSHNSGAGGGIGGRKMEGIGNPMFKDPRLQQTNSVSKMTIGQVASAVGSTVVGMIKDPLAKNASPRHSMPSVTVNYGNNNRIGNLPGYSGSGSSGYGGNGGGGGGGYGGNTGGGYGGGGIFNSPPPGAQQLAQSTGGAWTMASNRGPNAIGGGGSAAHAPSGVGGSWAIKSQPAGHTSVAAQARAEAHGSITSGVPISSTSYQNSGTAASDGSYERNLIEELCPPGGMRPEPPEDKLANFAQSVPSLNADLVCPVLLDALEDGQPWIIKAKTLCVIETTINSASNSMGASNPYSDFFHTCASEIEPLASHARPAVRDPAKRVLKALGIAITSSHTKTTRISHESKAPVVEPPPPPPEPVNLLDFGDEDEFGSSSMPQPPPVPASEPPPPPSVPPPAEPTKTTEDNSLFGGLQINGGKTSAVPETPKTEQTAASSENTTSAFGFIGGQESETPAASIPVAKQTPTAEEELLMLSTPSETAPISTNPPIFDPLLSLGNGTSRPQAPKLTNAQIEAMSYQQNMLMMQQQMQQMQMAMVMQQQQQQGGHANMVMNKQPSFKNVMQSSTMAPSYIPDMKMMKPIGNTNRSDMAQFSILENAKKEEQQKSFDFIKDAMKGAK